MPFLTPLLNLVTGWLGPRFAHLAKPLLGLIALLALAGLLWAGIAYHDSNVVVKHDAKIEQRAAKATDQAATERANDTITLAKTEQETHNVIQAQPDQPIAPTSHALSCERLRRLGRAPPSCR
jgi:hypothetical protein